MVDFSEYLLINNVSAGDLVAEAAAIFEDPEAFYSLLEYNARVRTTFIGTNTLSLTYGFGNRLSLPCSL